nr:MAG TPA: hypothetical protein [Caudoviricetes sp.]
MCNPFNRIYFIFAFRVTPGRAATPSPNGDLYPCNPRHAWLAGLSAPSAPSPRNR